MLKIGLVRLFRESHVTVDLVLQGYGFCFLTKSSQLFYHIHTLSVQFFHNYKNFMQKNHSYND